MANPVLITGRSHRRSLWWQFHQINSQCFRAGELCLFKILLPKWVPQVTVKSCKHKQTPIYYFRSPTYPQWTCQGGETNYHNFLNKLNSKCLCLWKISKKLNQPHRNPPNKNFPEQPFWVKFFQRPGVLVTSLTQVVHPIIWIIHATAHPLTKTLSCATSGVSLTKNLDEHVFELILNLFWYLLPQRCERKVGASVELSWPCNCVRNASSWQDAMSITIF